MRRLVACLCERGLLDPVGVDAIRHVGSLFDRYAALNPGQAEIVFGDAADSPADYMHLFRRLATMAAMDTAIRRVKAIRVAGVPGALDLTFVAGSNSMRWRITADGGYLDSEFLERALTYFGAGGRHCLVVLDVKASERRIIALDRDLAGRAAALGGNVRVYDGERWRVDPAYRTS